MRMMVKNRLKQIRHEMMIDKQIEMANLLELAQAQYNRYEQNQVQPSFAGALRIAKKLKRSVEEVFYLVDE